jgi:serine/threonine-protein kinase
MGQVYRATDTKLKRQVAIKILPPSVAADHDRLARFQREAEVLASLNHPNIAGIYGLEESAGATALVMELVEGEDLSQRIVRGAIPIDEALPIAKQIAEALEAAHEQGIIHRDLKPANVQVREDGTVKVLDFGLAKTLDPAPGQDQDAMTSPTLTARATYQGLIIGTAAYMAPEQARGRAVDRRADIWAFGVVLYEMLSGKRPFPGDDVSSTLASVLKDNVDWTALPADLPSPVTRLLRRCLDKNPKHRLSSIGDARLELEEASGNPEPAVPIVPLRARWWRALPWAFGLLGLGTGAAAVLMWPTPRESAAPVRARVITETGMTTAIAGAVGSNVLISSDGETLVFVGGTASAVSPQRQLYRRRFTEFHASRMAGTEGAFAPFFKPDGQWVGFFADGKLKKVPITGGAPVVLCDAEGGRGGWWGEDGTIVFSPHSQPGTVLHRVPDNGGTPQALGSVAKNDVTQRWPQLLPGSRAVLYSGLASTSVSWDDANVTVRRLDGGDPRVLVRGGFHARYVRSGHVVYIHKRTLFAIPFDLTRLEASGDPVPILEDVSAVPLNGSADFSLSGGGTLIYRQGTPGGALSPLRWLDASGRLTTLRAQATDWQRPRFSRDGRLALSIAGGPLGPATDIWLHEPERDLTKLTFHRLQDNSPVWTPDSEHIVFASERDQGTVSNLYYQRANGTGPVLRLTESPLPQVPFSIHPSGKHLAFVEGGPRVGQALDIKILPLESDGKGGLKPGSAWTFLGTAAIENQPAFSPDGRWLAYTSNESGSDTSDLFVTSFPAGDRKWKVSSEGGIWPAWSEARQELFYVVPSGQHDLVMVAPYTIEGTVFRAGRVRQWSEVPIGARDRGYALHPDGKRMIVGSPDSTLDGRSTVAIAFDFFDELRRKAPVK